VKLGIPTADAKGSPGLVGAGARNPPGPAGRFAAPLSPPFRAARSLPPGHARVTGHIDQLDHFETQY
jgi:hypothetical protein